MGLGDGEMTGLTLHDTLSIIKGHVPEGHKVRMKRIVITLVMTSRLHPQLYLSVSISYLKKSKLHLSIPV